MPKGKKNATSARGKGKGPLQRPEGGEREKTTRERRPTWKARESSAASTGEREEPEIVQLSSNDTDNPEGMSRNGFSDIFQSIVQSPAPSPVPFPSNQPTDFGLPRSILRCIDDDLSLHVPEETCKRIWIGEYINIAQLNRKDLPVSESSNLVISSQGQIEVRPRSIRAVNSIRGWTDGFLVYASIYIRKHLEQACDLLHYMNTIRDAESMCGGSYGWMTYDENFRMRQAVKPQSWARTHSELWLKTIGTPLSSAFFMNQAIPVLHRPQSAPKPGFQQYQRLFIFQLQVCTQMLCL